jgi:hypothetical protein
MMIFDFPAKVVLFEGKTENLDEKMIVRGWSGVQARFFCIKNWDESASESPRTV